MLKTKLLMGQFIWFIIYQILTRWTFNKDEGLQTRHCNEPRALAVEHYSHRLISTQRLFPSDHTWFHAHTIENTRHSDTTGKMP